MTKGQLIKKLEKFNENEEVFMYTEEHLYKITDVYEYDQDDVPKPEIILETELVR